MTNIQKNAQLVSNTLQTLQITSDYETMNKLLGCLNVLSEIGKEAAQLEKMLDDLSKSSTETVKEPEIKIEAIESQ